MVSFDVNKIKKNNITLTEYSNPENSQVEKVYLQSGVVGFFANRSELADLMHILYYYLNIEDIFEIEGE
jgi:hypothetical protein